MELEEEWCRAIWQAQLDFIAEQAALEAARLAAIGEEAKRKAEEERAVNIAESFSLSGGHRARRAYQPPKEPTPPPSDSDDSDDSDDDGGGGGGGGGGDGNEGHEPSQQAPEELLPPTAAASKRPSMSSSTPAAAAAVAAAASAEDSLTLCVQPPMGLPYAFGGFTQPLTFGAGDVTFDPFALQRAGAYGAAAPALEANRRPLSRGAAKRAAAALEQASALAAVGGGNGGAGVDGARRGFSSLSGGVAPADGKAPELLVREAVEAVEKGATVEGDPVALMLAAMEKLSVLLQGGGGKPDSDEPHSGCPPVTVTTRVAWDAFLERQAKEVFRDLRKKLRALEGGHVIAITDEHHGPNPLNPWSSPRTGFVSAPLSPQALSSQGEHGDESSSLGSVSSAGGDGSLAFSVNPNNLLSKAPLGPAPRIAQLRKQALDSLAHGGGGGVDDDWSVSDNGGSADGDAALNAHASDAGAAQGRTGCAYLGPPEPLEPGTLVVGRVPWGSSRLFEVTVDDPRSFLTVVLAATSPVEQRPGSRGGGGPAVLSATATPTGAAGGGGGGDGVEHKLPSGVVWSLAEVERRRPAGLAKADLRVAKGRVPNVESHDFVSASTGPKDRVVIPPTHPAGGAGTYVVEVHAPPFQQLVDLVCAQLDDQGRVQKVGRRYRGAPLGGGGGGSSEQAPHGLLFGGGAAPADGAGFALLVHQTGKPTRPLVAQALQIGSGSNNVQGNGQGNGQGNSRGSSRGDDGDEDFEGWNSTLSSLAGGAAVMARVGLLLEKLRRLEAMDVRVLAGDFEAARKSVDAALRTEAEARARVARSRRRGSVGSDGSVGDGAALVPGGEGEPAEEQPADMQAEEQAGGDRAVDKHAQVGAFAQSEFELDATPSDGGNEDDEDGDEVALFETLLGRIGMKTVDFAPPGDGGDGGKDEEENENGDDDDDDEDDEDDDGLLARALGPPGATVRVLAASGALPTTQQKQPLPLRAPGTVGVAIGAGGVGVGVGAGMAGGPGRPFLVLPPGIGAGLGAGPGAGLGAGPGAIGLQQPWGTGSAPRGSIARPPNGGGGAIGLPTAGRKKERVGPPPLPRMPNYHLDETTARAEKRAATKLSK